MKVVLGLVIALFIHSGVFAQGIEFEHGTFAEALVKAKQENKLVFMDCYTSWCKPCKLLVKNVFPQKEVGDLFNERFVNLKVDMEKGEGLELNKRYDVVGYPTLLFIDANGEVVHRRASGCDVAELIEEANIALDPTKQIAALEKRYDNGERDNEVVISLVKALFSNRKMEKMKMVSEEYLANCSKDQLLSVDTYTILAYSRALKYESEVFKHWVANKEQLIVIDEIGERGYNAVIGLCVGNYIRNQIATASMKELKNAIEKSKQYHLFPNQEEMESGWYSAYYLANKEFDTWYEKQIQTAQKVSESNKEQGKKMFVDIAISIAIKPSFKGSNMYQKALDKFETLLIEDDSKMSYYCLAVLYKNVNNKEKALANIKLCIGKLGGKEDKFVGMLEKAIEAM